MQNSPSRSRIGSNRRPALIGLWFLGLAGVGLFGIWWIAAIKTPMVTIPNPIMPRPNAFDFYLAAGNALASSNAIRDAVSITRSGPYSLAQKEALVQQNAGVINTLHQGFAYPYLNPPYRRSHTTPPLTYSLFIRITALLQLRGNVQAAKGDWSGSAESYLDAMRLGEDIPHGSTLAGAIIGSACQNSGRQPMWQVLNHLNAAQSRVAAKRLMSIMERHFPYADTLQEEKWYGQSIRLEIFNDSKERNNLILSNGAAGNPGTAAASSFSALLYLAYSKKRIMHDYTTYMDSSTTQARRPYAAKLLAPPLPNDPINATLMQYTSHSRLDDVVCETQNGLLLIMLAIHAFQSEQGRPPNSLMELAPAYLKQLPNDPFAPERTFQYRVQGKSYVLYSVGPDGKDDGGRPIDDQKKAQSTRSVDPNNRYVVEANSVGDVVAGINRW